mmetsp:Transcript_26477/g.82340  ORF Transcript_26477/g.82340 Transcript_26477/m.82340 type:complete len:284 (-) Transcript_26477:195-1046(-)
MQLHPEGPLLVADGRYGRDRDAGAHIVDHLQLLPHEEPHVPIRLVRVHKWRVGPVFRKLGVVGHAHGPALDPHAEETLGATGHLTPELGDVRVDGPQRLVFGRRLAVGVAELPRPRGALLPEHAGEHLPRGPHERPAPLQPRGLQHSPVPGLGFQAAREDAEALLRQAPADLRRAAVPRHAHPVVHVVRQGQELPRGLSPGARGPEPLQLRLALALLLRLLQGRQLLRLQPGAAGAASGTAGPGQEVHLAQDLHDVQVVLVVAQVIRVLGDVLHGLHHPWVSQ